MGPKGKSQKQFAQLKSSAQNGMLAAKASNMRNKASALTLELENLSVQYDEKVSELATRKSEYNLLLQENSDLCSQIEAKNIIILDNQSKLARLDSEIKCQKKRIAYKRKAYSIDSSIELNCLNYRPSKFTISNEVARKRKLKPYSDDTHIDIKKRRCREIFQAASFIVGGSKENKAPILECFLDTIGQNFKSVDVVTRLSLSKAKHIQKLNRNCIVSWHNSFFKSTENKMRSLSIYYSHNVMGKEKYISLRKANRNSDYQQQQIANYIPYKELSVYIRSIDIGVVNPVSEVTPGCCRQIGSFVLRLAEFYMSVNQHRKDKLMEFPSFEKKSADSFLFLLSFGGDGAPGVGTVFNISFINVGCRLLSSSETHMVFGADVDETSDTVKIFLKQAVQDFEYLESKVFTVKVQNIEKQVEFKLTELPNDMKMLCFLGGELSNAAKYFTTFADVSSVDSLHSKKVFGVDWKPYPYSRRLTDGKKAQMKWNEINSSNNAYTTKRSKFTNYISNTLNSRQEKTPLMGRYISEAKADPLHLKNNVCKEYFNKFWIIIYCSVGDKAKSFGMLKDTSIFASLVNFIRKDMKLNALAKKMISWFNETTRSIEKDFKYRFRGQESNAFLKHFPTLFLKFLYTVENDSQKKKMFFRTYYQLIYVRKLVSYSVRLLNFSQSDLDDNILCGRKLFVACCKHYTAMSPSLWVLCNAAPNHAKLTFSSYGFGLGVNSMEPREQKHQRIKKYSENTTPQNKWPMIFRHEFVSTIFLREMGYDAISYRPSANKYVPDVSEGFCSNCGLTLSGTVCILCNDPSYLDVLKSLEKFI